MPKNQSQRKAKKASQPKPTSKQVPLSVGYQAPKPSFRSLPPLRGCVAYGGVDYVGSLDSTTSAQADGYMNMNVRTAATFPRLSAIANVFRRFYFRKLKYHLYGKSASTQKGVLGFASIVDDITGDDAGIVTEAEVKNIQGAISLKGWESGTHVVDVGAQGLKWYLCDPSEGFLNYNPGYTYFSLPATTTAADLSWDVYVEYEVEFDIAIPAGNQGFGKTKKLEQTPEVSRSLLRDQMLVLQDKLEELKTKRNA